MAAKSTSAKKVIQVQTDDVINFRQLKAKRGGADATDEASKLQLPITSVGSLSKHVVLTISKKTIV